MFSVLRRLAAVLLIGSTLWWVNRHFADPSAAPYWLTIVEHVLRAMLALGLALSVDAAIRLFFWQGYVEKVVRTKVPRLLPLTVSMIVYTATLFNLLKYDYGLSFGGAIAASGAVALILSLALRSVILDLFSGLAVSVDRSYAVGDWITVTSRDFVEPVYGEVEEIDWRTTRLRREDGTLFVMPNSLGGIFAITNHSQPRAPKRLECFLTLPHETSVTRIQPLIEGAVLRAVEQEGLCSSPTPRILISEISLHGVQYLIRFWADIHICRPSSATHMVLQAVHTAIAQNDISFPGNKVEIQNRQETLQSSRKQCASTEDALGRAPIFSNHLIPEEISALAQTATYRNLPAGANLVTQGEPGSSMFIIMSGAGIVLYTNGEAAAHQLAVLSTGDVVGEMSLLTGEERSATVKAKTPIAAIEIKQEDIAPLLKARPQIVDSLSLMLAERSAAQTKADQSTDSDTAQASRDSLRQTVMQSIKRLFSLP